MDAVFETVGVCENTVRNPQITLQTQTTENVGA